MASCDEYIKQEKSQPGRQTGDQECSKQRRGKYHREDVDQKGVEGRPDCQPGIGCISVLRDHEIADRIPPQPWTQYKPKVEAALQQGAAFAQNIWFANESP